MRKTIDLRVAPAQCDDPHSVGATKSQNCTSFYIVPDVWVGACARRDVVRPHRPRYILETHS